MTEESQKILSPSITSAEAFGRQNERVAHFMAKALYDLGFMHETEHKYDIAQQELEESLSLFSSFNTEGDETTMYFMALAYKCYGVLLLDRDDDKIKARKIFR